MSNAKPDARLGRQKGEQLDSGARNKDMVGIRRLLGTPHLPDRLHPSAAARLGVIRRLLDMDRLTHLQVPPHFLAALVTATLAALHKRRRTPPHNLLTEDRHKARLGVATDLHHLDKVDGVLDGETVLFV
jgi:hypothetical protein